MERQDFSKERLTESRTPRPINYFERVRKKNERLTFSNFTELKIVPVDYFYSARTSRHPQIRVQRLMKGDF